MVKLQERVLSILDNTAARYDIAGGWPRDLSFGITPTDLDIWVYPVDGKTNGAAYATLQTFFPLAFKTCFLYAKESDKETNMDDPNTSMIGYILRNPAVDVIFLNDKCTTTLDLVNRFDCSLNRFVMRNDEWWYVDFAGILTKWKPATYHQQCRTNPKREAKMKMKCINLTGHTLIEIG